MNIVAHSIFLVLLLLAAACLAPVHTLINEDDADTVAGNEDDADTVGGEVWSCKDPFDGYYSAALVTAAVNETRLGGEVIAAGETQQTAFHVAGINRRWDWGLQPEGGYQYALIITPDGTGKYFDFGIEPTAKPSDIFKRYRQRQRRR